MLIAEKFHGRDATIDPYYLAELRNIAEDADIERIEREIAELRAELERQTQEYNQLVERVNTLEEADSEMKEQILILQGTISELRDLIDGLQAQIDSMDQFEPISVDFINNLEPYNSQEGEG